MQTFVTSKSSFVYVGTFLLKAYVGGAQTFLTTCRSDMSDLAKCHDGFLKQNINILEMEFNFLN